MSAKEHVKEKNSPVGRRVMDGKARCIWFKHILNS